MSFVPLKDRTLENDIKYSGPLSYRYLRILGWLFLVISAIGMVAQINTKLVPSSVDKIGWISNVADYFSALPLPLFLLANFAFILQKKNKWKSLLMFYGGISLGLYIVANVVMIHYAYGFVNAFIKTDFQVMAKIFGTMLFSMGSSGLVFNIFIDLFLCSLTFFFLNYKPKKLKGNYVYLFRALVILPIAYEIASIIIKYNLATGNMLIPFYFFFLLTSKPPLMFVAFLAMVITLKVEEFVRRKEDPKFLEEHRKTNAHSLKFSIVIAITFFAAGLLDFILAVMFSLGVVWNVDVVDPELAEEIVDYGVNVATSMGFGKAVTLMAVAPIALLFSYTKTHKNPKIDKFIPIVGIVLIVFVFAEGLFQIIVNNVPIVIDRIKTWIESLFG